jgi:pimeloyl-ACP methyl ester carboxylesterase
MSAEPIEQPSPLDATANHLVPPATAILVHGTFARRARWCLPTSDFCTSLQRQLGGSVKFDIFNWSGFNLHRARIVAGERLAARIRRVASSSPGTKIVLIGHSHGGNVIRYAFRRPDVASLVSGVVTLATPFIAIAPRRYVVWLTSLTQAVAINALIASLLTVFIGAMSILLWTIFLAKLSVGTVKPFMRPIAILVLIPLAVSLFAGLRHLYVNRIGYWMSALERKLAKLQHEMVAEIAPPVIDGTPLLSIAVYQDEARLLLGSSSLLSEWTHKIISDEARNEFVVFFLLPPPVMYAIVQANAAILRLESLGTGNPRTAGWPSISLQVRADFTNDGVRIEMLHTCRSPIVNGKNGAAHAGRNETLQS